MGKCGIYREKLNDRVGKPEYTYTVVPEYTYTVVPEYTYTVVPKYTYTLIEYRVYLVDTLDLYIHKEGPSIKALYN